MPETLLESSPSEPSVNVPPQSAISFATTDGPRPVAKKRKVERACDLCRRKKTKCDGPKMPNNICSSCTLTRKRCTYLEASRPRGPSKAYITGMEDRLERMEAFLKKIHPETDFTAELGPPIIRDSWKEQQGSHAPTTNSIFPLHSPPLTTLHAYPSDNSLSFTQHRVPTGLFNPSRRRASRTADRRTPQTSDSDSESSPDMYTSSDYDEPGEGPERRVTSLELHASKSSEAHNRLNVSAMRFHGKSSQTSLIRTMRKFKEQRLQELTYSSGSGRTIDKFFMRPEFWSTPPWEMSWEGLRADSTKLFPSLIEEFPPEDLAEVLCDLYFEHVNSMYPLLHRPTFLRQFRARLHYRDHWFASLCLSIFAVASRWCDDPRVITDKFDGEGDLDWHRAGWKYFSAALGVHYLCRSIMNPTCLFEVQTFPLLSMFWRGCACQPNAWIFIGVGIRKAQDVGAHRKKVYRNKPSVEEDLWKRVFWLLVSFDRIDSAELGRSCNTRDEDFDLDLPLEVDDDYWESENRGPTSPNPSKPVPMTAFNRWVKLTQIIGYALGTLYAVNKSKMLLGTRTNRWREEVLTQLDNSLAEWLTALPEHLKWSNKIENQLFSRQSATLCIAYHMTRILVYRPFIPPPKAANHSLEEQISSQFPFPAVSICNDAAKSCAKFIEDQMYAGLSDIPYMIAGAHVSAAVLLAGIWALKAKEKTQAGVPSEDIKPPIAQTVDSLMGNALVLLRVLEHAAPRWMTASYYLQAVRASLPDLSEGSTPADGAHVNRALQHLASYDRPMVHMPGMQDVDGWQWYSTGRVTPSSPSYTTTSNVHQTFESDAYSTHWQKHELRQVDDVLPQLPFPIQARFSFQPPSYQRYTGFARNVYPAGYGEPPPMRPCREEIANPIYDINDAGERTIPSNQTICLDTLPTTEARRRSHGHGDASAGCTRDGGHGSNYQGERYSGNHGVGPSVHGPSFRQEHPAPSNLLQGLIHHLGFSFHE